MNGFININKPVGITSHDVVSIIRKRIGQKKVGHTGTLDPGASGVLVICLGKATKVFDLIVNFEKEYKAVLKLGVTTDTQDGYGNIISNNKVEVNDKDIYKSIRKFMGSIEQIPPMYSAIKVNGKKLYDYARRGINIERKKRKIQIHNIDINKIDLKNNLVEIIVTCSKGTYIRTLCNDIGQVLGCGAYMYSLQRTRNGIFTIEDSYSLDNTEIELENVILPIDTIFQNLKYIIVNNEGQRRIINGGILTKKMIEYCEEDLKFERKYRIYDKDNNFLAIYKAIEDKYGNHYLKIVKSFVEV